MYSCPVDGLPSEILAVIFVTLNERCHYARSTGDDSYGTIDYPIILSSVCSRWRHVVLHSPYLWRHIDFATAGNTLHNLGRVKYYLDRAQNSPLQIRFRTAVNGCLPTRVDQPIASLLCSASSYIESLAISYYHSTFAQEVISTLFAQEETPPITELALHAHSGDGRMIAMPEVLSLQKLDQLFVNLESIYLDSVSPDWDRFPCENLVELQIIELPLNGFPNIHQLAKILKNNPRLRAIKLCGFYLEPTSEVELDSIPLVDLQSLYLDLNPKFVKQALQLINPGAHDLSLTIVTWSGEGATDIISTFVSFSNRARITSLHLSKSGILFSSIVHCLPHLQVLRLSSQMLVDATFAGIREMPGLLPHLHTFEIQSCATATNALQDGLQTICRLPSLRRIKHNGFDQFSDGMRLDSKAIANWFIRERGRDDVTVEESRDLHFLADPSPFI